MIFCLDRETQRFVIATNLRSVSREFEIPYYRLQRAFSNGTVRKEIGKYVIYKGEVLKGNQRIIKKVKTERKPKETKNELF